MIGHFHTHSHYSVLDGAMTIDELVDRALKRKIDAIAITEHGNIFSAVEFFFKASEAGIKPIIGCEIYISPGKMTEKVSEERNYHATLLVKDEAGYRNLCNLLKIANVEGFYRKPRVDLKTLFEYSEGLIVLSGCLNGPIPRLILEGKIDKARELAIQFKKVFGDFYLEIMRGDPMDPTREEDLATISSQRKVNDYLLEFSKDLGIPVVATSDCHYADPDSHEIQDMLICIGYGEKKFDAKRKYRYKVKGLYVRSKDEVVDIFSDIPHALETHEDIIKKCRFEFKRSKELKIPQPPEFGNPDETLRRKAEEGLKRRFEEKRRRGEKFNEEEYWNRLEKELDVISKKRFSSYFLIVEDFINFAKRNGIMVGPGRGSAAGAIVSWALGITELDPVKYSLIFERFLNPEREKPPDIDVDFCKERRDEVLEYVRKKYGSENVAHIITFGTFGARAAVRDVGRILGEPLSDVSYLAELIPQEPSRKWTLDDAYNEIPEVKRIVDENPRFKRIFENAKKLEGLIRHIGSHASGFLISDKPLTEYTSVHKSKDGFVTQFEMESLEKIGLVKFDFLGLETLTIINKTFKLVKERHDIELSYDKIPLDDKKTYDMLKKGDVFGVFQFESAGMRELLKKLEPDNIEDLIAAVALYRPGPLQSGMVNDFIERKKGIKKVEYPHPKLEPILKDTYGNFLYQEQIMFAANILAGFTMGEADILREAMGKKKAELMAKMRERFISGCEKNGISKEKAEEIFNIMEKFAGYAFNKSHSAAYAFVAYITAYLKANFPLEYMASLLSAEMHNFDKLSKYIVEIMKEGFRILPPSITKSDYEFKVEGDAIRYGLGGIKGLGKSAAKSIEELRKKIRLTSFEGFISSARKFGINKKVIETLIKAGAFDEFIDRKKAFRVMEALSKGKALLFADKEEAKKDIDVDEIEKMESEVLGVVLSKTSLEDEIKKVTHGFLPIEIKDIIEVAGLVKNKIPSKRGFLITLEVSADPSKNYEVLLISTEGEEIKRGEIYIFLGKKAGRRIIAKRFFQPSDVFLVIRADSSIKEKAERIKQILSEQSDGETKVIVELNGQMFEYKRKISLSDKLKTRLWENGFTFILAPNQYIPQNR